MKANFGKNFLRLIVSILAAFFFLLGHGLPARAEDHMLVDKEGVYLRTGPGTDYRATTQLERGTDVVARSRRGEWVEVAIDKDGQQVGWVHGSLLQAAAQRFVSGSRVTVRNGPGPDYATVTILEKGARVLAHSQEGEWAGIVTADTRESGWIHGSLLTETEVASGLEVASSGGSTKAVEPPEPRAMVIPAVAPQTVADDKDDADVWRTFPDGSEYIGRMKDDKFHGQGTLSLANGARYTGEFRNGVFHGQGAFTVPNDQEYTGQFEDGRYNGQGRILFHNGIEYKGEFKNNRLHGQGALTIPDGPSYTGEFRDDLYYGYGRITFPNGDRYEGEFERNNVHGRGTFFFVDGRILTGQWRDGMYAGE